MLKGLLDREEVLEINKFDRRIDRLKGWRIEKKCGREGKVRGRSLKWVIKENNCRVML